MGQVKFVESLFKIAAQGNIRPAVGVARRRKCLGAGRVIALTENCQDKSYGPNEELVPAQPKESKSEVLSG
jgi:hypothetical protein